ncbi:hypothetical protein DUD79_14835 [Priestia aryabhattai]
MLNGEKYFKTGWLKYEMATLFKHSLPIDTGRMIYRKSFNRRALSKAVSIKQVGMRGEYN